MPNERTRALIQTRHFLVELAEDSALSASIRRQPTRGYGTIPMPTRYCGRDSSKRKESTD
ncbi:BPSL0761 family protein [Pseudomonas fluorescens]|uniref:BPSL0761 family protein n=1 Tax=Pseudomonas fluorescens TaxID=294 RepID=UPI0029667ED7|nr:BPSL0761 family protein [Pseudomonas fluorescens]